MSKFPDIHYQPSFPEMETNLIQQEADRLTAITNSPEYIKAQTDWQAARQQYGLHARETLILRDKLFDIRGGIQVVKVPLSKDPEASYPNIKYTATGPSTAKSFPDSVEFELNQRAIRKYGLTNIPQSIGYITRKGQGIDSSGIRLGSNTQSRTVDHREIAQDALGKESTTSYTEAMREFMDKTGDIRVVGTSNIDVPIAKGMPTQAQLDKIRELSQDKPLYYDIVGPKGKILKEAEGTFNTFLYDLRNTIQNEAELSTSLSSGKMSSQLQPLVDFIKKHNLSEEAFTDARYNKDNPLFNEYRIQMDKTGVGVTKIWSDFGYNNEREFYNAVLKEHPEIVPDLKPSYHLKEYPQELEPGAAVRIQAKLISTALGVTYNGAQFKNWELVYLTFTDPVTGSTFGAKNLEEAKKALAAMREKFGKGETDDEYKTELAKLEAPVDPQRNRLKEVGVLIKDFIAKQNTRGGLTNEEARQFEKLTKEADTIRYNLVKPIDIAKLPTPEERQSTIPAAIVLIAQQDLLKDRAVYDAIATASHGVYFNADTDVDKVFKGQSTLTAQHFYETFSPTREAMRKHYGSTIILYRATGQQKPKITTNWATTEAFAKQFGNNVISKEVLVDDIVALNVGLNGKYHEVIVLDRSLR